MESVIKILDSYEEFGNQVDVNELSIYMSVKGRRMKI